MTSLLKNEKMFFQRIQSLNSFSENLKSERKTDREISRIISAGEETASEEAQKRTDGRGKKYPPTVPQAKGERYESLLQSERDDLDAIRRNPKVRDLYQFLETGLQTAVEPGALQAVPANTRQRKRIARVTRAFGNQVVFWQTQDPGLMTSRFLCRPTKEIA